MLGMLLMSYVPVMQLSLYVIANLLRLGMLLMRLELLLFFQHALWLLMCLRVL